MSGFFPKQQVISNPKQSCIKCGLYRTCKSPRMKPYGEFKKRILNIGEAPGNVEDQHGKPWQGRTGKLLQDFYQKAGIDLFEDCLSVNAVSCHPADKQGRNRTPTSDEIAACRRLVLRTIDQYKPHVIVLFGNAAVQSVIGHRWQKELGGVTKWRGWAIPDRDFNCWVIPVFHPSYVARADTIEVDTVWRKDLERIVELTNKRVPVYKEPDIEVIDDLKILYNLQRVSIDFETTGIKPHAAGHRIVSCAIANGLDHAYTFMIPETRNERKPLVDLLADPLIEKIAHNMKFEEIWSTIRLRQPIANWIWDTMLAAHVLDNRQGVTSLKFQVYVNFGIIDYSSDIAPYLESGSKDGNALNRIDELLKRPGGRDQLLKYNALDAVHTYRLAEKQKTEIMPF